MSSTFKAFLSDESGATAIEYGLITALVSVVAIAALTEVGDALVSIFGKVSSTLNAQATSPTP